MREKYEEGYDIYGPTVKEGFIKTELANPEDKGLLSKGGRKKIGIPLGIHKLISKKMR